MKRYLVEAVGTFFLALAVTTAGLAGNTLAVGLMLVALIYMGAHISGGHYNPALSTAAWLRGALSMNNMVGYKLAQIVGALLVGVLFYGLTGEYLMIPVQGGLAFGFVSEALLTFVFASVFLVLATTDRYKTAGIAGLVIGLTLTALASLGALLNPAIGFCSLVCSLMKSDTTAAMDCLVVHILGPIAGAIVAAIWFKFINKAEARTAM